MWLKGVKFLNIKLNTESVSYLLEGVRESLVAVKVVMQNICEKHTQEKKLNFTF